jgi:hypothetical protein
MGSHSRQTPSDGIHTPIAFEYANAAARTAAGGFDQTYDIYKVAVDQDTGLLFYIDSIDSNGDATWTPFAGNSISLSDDTPEAVSAAAGAAGTDPLAARDDHSHQVSVGTPVDIGSANAAGSSNALARADHVHDHADQGGGTLHAEATGSDAGFMSASDKSKLDGYPATLPVFGQNYQFESRDAETSTTNGSYQVKVGLTTPSLPSGTYLVQWSCSIANNYSRGDYQLWDSTGSTELDYAQYEGRGGDHPIKQAGMAEVTFSGIRTFQIRYRNVGGGSAQFISFARLTIWGVA